MHVKHRSPVTIIVLSIITFGVYALYWIVKTKQEMSGLGATVPTAWLVIVPIANIYFAYRYAEGFSLYVKKDSTPLLWFLLIFVMAPVAMILMQIELNKYAEGSHVSLSQ